MENDNLILYSLIGFVTWIVITYYIIQGAVRSALKNQEFYLRTMYRIQIRKMVDAGYDKDDLSKLQHSGDGDFWDSLPIKRHEQSTTN